MPRQTGTTKEGEADGPKRSCQSERFDVTSKASLTPMMLPLGVRGLRRSVVLLVLLVLLSVLAAGGFPGTVKKKQKTQNSSTPPGSRPRV